MACQEVFLRELRARGFRLTPQREMVLSVMHDMESHITVEDVYQRVSAISPAVDISTVYRTLDLLQQFGLVTSVEPGDGQRRYELLALHGPHIHLVCSRCGMVVGLPVEAANALCSQALANHDFTADLGQLSVPGLCSQCKANESSQG